MRAEALERRGAVTMLAYICDHPGCLQEDIIRGRTDIETPGGMNARTDAIRRLLNAGLVERGDGHLQHHAKPLKATAKGQRIIEVLREVESQ